jgi:putative transcriptional regulator
MAKGADIGKGPGGGAREASAMAGQFLIAVPGVHGDDFDRTVIYLHKHSRAGAMGFIINRDLPIVFDELMVRLGIQKAALTPARRDRRPRVRHGGPVDEERGYVLHPHGPPKMPSGQGEDGVLPLAVSTSLDMLRMIARGEGPETSLLVLGHAGWAPGQLDKEMAQNAWFNAPVDTDLVFSRTVEHAYDLALKSIGVSASRMSPQSGHA